MIKQSKGITLVALVITIIILVILAGTSISVLTNQGIFAQANRAKKEAQRAQVTEWLNLKLIEEQMYNPTGAAEEIIEAARAASDGNEDLAKMGKAVVVDANTSTIEDGEQVAVYFYVQVDEDVYKVEMEGAKFIGEAGKFPPVITLESITSTTNSITVKVSTKRNEGGKIEYYIKVEDEEKYTLVDTKTETTYTYTGLEQNKKYNVKIVAVAENKQTTEILVDKIITKKSVTEIKITPESSTLKIGEKLGLSVTILPEDAYNKNINWTSSNLEVATTDQNGNLTAVVAGTTIITATAQDGSGVQGSCTIEVKNPYPTLASIAEPGDYVEYDGENGYTGKWQVLYNDSTYGLQIISSNAVIDSYTLSGESGYNGVVDILNTVCRKYVNTLYATSGRCVGSNPLSPDDAAGTTDFWGYTAKNVDSNYTTDYNAMKTINILNIGKTYWLASRDMEPITQGEYFYVRSIDSSGNKYNNNVWSVRSYGVSTPVNYSNGVRTIITLISDIQTNSGDGSASTPYKLVAQ